MGKKLAECLLRRKELQEKLDRMKSVDVAAIYEVKVERRKVTDTVDDIIAKVPRITYADFQREYSFYARQLRLIDGAIQHSNWTVEVTDVDKCFDDFRPE